jgi:hypothetical protein
MFGDRCILVGDDDEPEQLSHCAPRPVPWFVRLMMRLHIWCYSKNSEHCDKCGDSGR